MKMKKWLPIVLAIVVAAGPPDGGHQARAQQEEPSSPRAAAPVTFLQMNDVYSPAPVDGAGGLARVATLKRNLVAAGRTPLLIMAGDFLSPSVASSIFKGEQMVAALNAAGLDLATLGNHEFDFGVDVLLQRMAEAKWQWVVSNVVDTNTGQPIGGAAPYLVRTFGLLRVGFIGLCLVTDEINRERLSHVRLIDPFEAAATYLPRLAAERVDVVVAITHLPFADDRALTERFPEIDLIIGGHEHYPLMALENRTLISKAGSDARFVARIDVNRRARTDAAGAAAAGPGPVERFYELLPITAAIPDEPGTAAVVASFESKLGVELDAVVGTIRVPLDADTVRLRAGETNLGNLFADAMRAAAAADVAIVNSGSIRGDRVYPAGPLTRRTLLEIHPFGSVVCKVAISGRTLLEALNHGVARMPATAGQFPQVSGLTMRVEAAAPAADRVRDVRVGGTPLDPARTHTVAITDYQLSGGDGYVMFKGERVLVGPESGDLVVTALERFIIGRGDAAPAIEGRITISH